MVKNRNNSEWGEHWFLRSPLVSSSSNYLYAISSSGNLLSNANANQSNVYLSFAFCV